MILFPRLIIPFSLSFGLLLLMAYPTDLSAQQGNPFNKREISIIHLRAMERLTGYESLINRIGESMVQSPEMTRGIRDQFLELFVSRQVLLFNDLDPDYTLSPFYESETYINNLLLWYPDGIRIDLDIGNAKTGDIIPHGNGVFSLDFMVDKQINGNYLNQKLNTNTEQLLFRVAFNGSDGEPGNFRIVGIRSAGSAMIPDDSQSLEEVRSATLNENEIITVEQGIESLVRDYENYLLLLTSTGETSEDKAYYRQSFVNLFEDPEITIFNDLEPEPENYLVSISNYLNLLGQYYPQGINNLSVSADSVLFENVIREEDGRMSTYVTLNKFFSGLLRGEEVFRNMFPLNVRISFTTEGNSYGNFRIRSIDRETSDLFESSAVLPEPTRPLNPVSRKGFSATLSGSYGQTRIEDHNLSEMAMDADNHSWSFGPGYGITAGAGIIYSFGDRLAIGTGAWFNQYQSTFSISGTFEDYNLSQDINSDPFYKVMETNYDSAVTQNLVSLPLTLSYTSSRPGKVGIYMTAGLLFSYHLSGSYETTGSWKYYGHYPDNPPVIEYLEIEELGYFNNDRIDERGALESRGLSYSLTGSFGISIPIGYFTQIRIGPEIEWGLSDFNTGNEEHLDIFGNTKAHRPTYLVRYGGRIGLVLKL